MTAELYALKCDFRKEKDANCGGLRFRKSKIRQRGNRHLGIKRSQMRSDESQLQTSAPTYGSRQRVVNGRTHMEPLSAAFYSNAFMS